MTYNIIIILFLCVTWTQSQMADIVSNDRNEDYGVKLLHNNDDNYSPIKKDILEDEEKVRIQLYYECLCPYCINFEIDQFAPVVEAMSQYLEISTYPFGNARIINRNGTIEFKCQHGPAECYGNKLHACAIDHLQHTTALLYNVCLMKSVSGKGSDDMSADKCGQTMGIDSEPIKSCAKGSRGVQLLRYYGEESKKAKFLYVPYVLINGEEYTGDTLKKDVCAAFTKPPPPCTDM